MEKYWDDRAALDASAAYITKITQDSKNMQVPLSFSLELCERSVGRGETPGAFSKYSSTAPKSDQTPGVLASVFGVMEASAFAKWLL